MYVFDETAVTSKTGLHRLPACECDHLASTEKSQYKNQLTTMSLMSDKMMSGCDVSDTTSNCA